MEVATDAVYDAEDVTGSPPAAPQQRVAWPYEDTSARLAVRATVDSGNVTVGPEKLLSIEDEPRKRAKAAIIEYADLLSISYLCRRVIRSPNPCVALSADGPEDQAILDAATGIAAPFGSRRRATLLPEMGAGSPIGAVLADRLDGLALLADALFRRRGRRSG